MNNKNRLKKIFSFFTALSLVFTLSFFTAPGANAFDTDYIDKSGMELGYSIINGYSKLSIERGQYADSQKTAVYCGLDVSDVYTLSAAGIYCLANRVDLDRLIKDNSYAMQHIAGLDSFLKKAGVKNDRAAQYKSKIIGSSKKVYNSFDVLGLYIFDATDKRKLELMNKDYVDFVLDGGVVPRNMKDLNIDGKTDMKDALLIQQYLAKILKFDDDDINEYALFVCDINGDKEPDIRDVTEIMKSQSQAAN